MLSRRTEHADTVNWANLGSGIMQDDCQFSKTTGDVPERPLRDVAERPLRGLGWLQAPGVFPPLNRGGLGWGHFAPSSPADILQMGNKQELIIVDRNRSLDRSTRFIIA